MSRRLLGLLSPWLLSDFVGGGPRGALAQLGEPMDWQDVCTSEDLENYKDALCKPTFLVSSLAFNPMGPKKVTNVTLILQPSEKIPRDEWLAKQQWLDLFLPSMEPVGTVSSIITKRDLIVTAKNPIDADLPLDQGYNTVVNPLFERVAKYNTIDRTLRLYMNRGFQMLPDKDTEITICCMRLPNESPKDNRDFEIAAPTSEAPTIEISIRRESIKSSPYIDPGYQFEFLQVLFDPAVSMQLTTISFYIRPANDLLNRQQIILSMPQIYRVDQQDGIVEFTTAFSENPLDWMLFAAQALWNNTERSLAFFLREGQVLEKGRQVKLQTMPGEFRLPLDIEPNSMSITAQARSLDGIDSIIAPTIVDQTSHVPHVRTFLYSELTYGMVEPLAMTEVTFIFRTNRPLFIGNKLYLRLSGFRSEVVEVILIGQSKFHFTNHKARYHLPQNLMELNVSSALYCNEVNTAITFAQMYLPPALYVNDPSLLAWTSDPDATREPIDISPELCSDVCGGEQKTFIRSQIGFTPAEPRLPADITLTILPSIFIYEGDTIILHLYAFFCETHLVPLTGPGAEKIDRMAGRWYGQDYTLFLVVGKNQVVDNVVPLVINIAREENFRLPGLLSKNDGTLRIESRGAIITERPMKKVPPMGDEKLVISSRVDIEPDWKTDLFTPFARIRISFILNSDVLPNSTITIQLGGILRQPPAVASTPIGWSDGRSGQVLLSGWNAPLFFGVGQWSHDSCTLTLKMKNLYIYAGEHIRFFLETDMYFQLPPASYSNDPSFRIAIPGAGISEEKFKYSTKWVDMAKTFLITDLYYGARGDVWYPGQAPDVNFRFEPNLDLYSGTVITISLPGFTHVGGTKVRFVPPETALSNEYDISGFIEYGDWDPLLEQLIITVPRNNAIVRRTNVFRVAATGNTGFLLPVTSLWENDPSLTIKCDSNVHVFEEPIKLSPRLVRRTFLISKLEYHPPLKESIFMLIMRLRPAVNISYPDHIQVKLAGFRNSLSKQVVAIAGPSRRYVRSSEGQWNETTETLTLEMVPNGKVIEADEDLELRIEESQGFITPTKLQRNDPSIRILSVNNIVEEPIKESPMVGNMPYSPHRFCMYQYEMAVRTREALCERAKSCDPPLTDPCSPSELERCGCDSRLDEKFNFTFQGFNLEDTDTVHFQPLEEICSLDRGPMFLDAFNTQLSPPTLNKERDVAVFPGFMSKLSGYYRICYKHAGMLFDVGYVVVRPKCPSPLVMVQGTCVQHCPKTKIPIAGECLRDPAAMGNSDSQALMLSVRMKEVDLAGPHLSERNSDDQELRYYIYRYQYELARILNCDPKRIQVASISEGSLLVNTVFTTAGGPNGDGKNLPQTSERSPLALVSLLQAMQSDTSSEMYRSSSFRNIEKPQTLMQVVRRDFPPPPFEVRLCVDGTYRIFCPYGGDILTWGQSLTLFLLGVAIVPCLCSCLCCITWRIDRDSGPAVDDATLEKLRRDPRMVPDLYLQQEYARSWMEGRFCGEEWEKVRNNTVLAIGN